MSCLGINLKIWMDLYSENYNMLRVGIKELTHMLTYMSPSGKIRMLKASMLGLWCGLVMVQSLACVRALGSIPNMRWKKSILSKLIYEMNAILTNVLSTFWCHRQDYCKFLWKTTGFRITKTVWRTKCKKPVFLVLRPMRWLQQLGQCGIQASQMALWAETLVPC